MAFDVKVNHEQGFVHLVYSGDVEIEERKKARDEVFAVRKHYDLTRCLVETQNSNMRLSTKDIIHFANTFPDDLPPDYHVAVVAGQDADVDTLIENLASTAGLRIRAFKDRDAAIRWLTAY
ncbi:MAG: hypothetical protein ACWGOV_00260 [Acidiferrobacterales bacterium]